jgi:hypothetical protein
MSPISSYQPSEVYEYTYDLDSASEFQENCHQVNNGYPREHAINRLFDILSSIEIRRHYGITSIDDMEGLLRCLDIKIQECENYYASYRNRHSLFFLIIDSAKEFSQFIREDQYRGLPNTHNIQY